MHEGLFRLDRINFDLIYFYYVIHIISESVQYLIKSVLKSTLNIRSDFYLFKSAIVNKDHIKEITCSDEPTGN